MDLPLEIMARLQYMHQLRREQNSFFNRKMPTFGIFPPQQLTWTSWEIENFIFLEIPANISAFWMCILILIC